MRWVLALTALSCAALAAFACDEHFPRPLDDETPDGALADAADDDADAAPDAEADAASEGGALCDAGTGIAFTKLSTATLTAPVESALNDGQLYVLEQGGRALRLAADGSVSVFIDVSSLIVSGGEAGLLGIAFHPAFATNGYVYLYYTVPYPTQPPPDGVVFQSALVRYQSLDHGLTLDPTTAKRIMTVDQPFANHNGGTIRFGGDGYLYWGLGDGGSGGDPLGNGQNTGVLLGKMLRIDVDHGDPYAIPPSNPFATSQTAKPEIYAYGLRNPYRWRFDDVRGDLWVGDVGQDLHEEIDKVTLGGNYGWNIREGKSCYEATSCPGADAGLIDPVVDFNRDEASTIIGGVVYRGTAMPALTGQYVFGDFTEKHYFAMPIDAASPTPTVLAHGDDGISPTSFTLDATGEIVVTDYNGGVYRMTAAACP